MKDFLKKVSEVCKMIFGYGIMITLFVGGFTCFGYMLALVVGGDFAAQICHVIYKQIVPVIIYISTSMILFGLFAMYLAGEFALTPDKKKASKTEGER